MKIDFLATLDWEDYNLLIFITVLDNFWCNFLGFYF